MSEKTHIANTTRVTLFWVIATNFVISLILSYQYILFSGQTTGKFPAFYLHIAWISDLVIIFSLLYFTLFLISRLFRGIKPLYIIILPIMSLWQIFLLADTSIFKIFKFHINSMVLNLVFTEGAFDSVHLGFFTIFITFLLILVIFLFEFYLIRTIFNKIKQQNNPSVFVKSYKRLIFIFCIVFVLLADKLSFAFADLYGNTQIVRYSKTFPLYQSFTIKKIAIKFFGFNVDAQNKIKITKSESALNYPLEPLQFQSNGEKLNFVWIVIDAFRNDMLTDSVTPNIREFANRSQWFANHQSGGNATRFGIFSMFYGIYGSYWHQFLGEQTPPVLIEELKKQNYEFLILASTKLTFPEFRKTCFVSIPESIRDEFEGADASTKDPQLATYFINWTQQRDTSKPFFAFLFFDGPHGPYMYPDAFEKRKPAIKNANYITVDKKSASALKNGYMNALEFDDYLTGKIIHYIDSIGLLNNTMVLITGDHGEEFFEHGFFGHTSAFSKEQINTPLLIFIPKKNPSKILTLTSHHDIAPSCLELIGCTTPASSYSHGQSLFKEREKPYIFSSGWDNAAISDGNNTIIFSTETYNLGFFETRDSNYQTIDNENIMLKKQLIETARDFSKFNK